MKAFICNNFLGILIIVILGTNLSACATFESTPYQEVNTKSANGSLTKAEFQFTQEFPEVTKNDVATSSDLDVFKVGDSADVSFNNVDSLSGVYIVDRSGNITFPLIGAVGIAGLTIEDVQQTLNDKYGTTYLQRPNITVKLESRIFGRVIVDGSVQKPGVFEVSELINLTEAIALAEGLNSDADGKKVYLIRTIDGVRKVQLVNLKNVRLYGSRDPKVIPGDIIFVQDSKSRIVFNQFIKTLPLLNTLAIFGTRR